jgi:hypothetical protein
MRKCSAAITLLAIGGALMLMGALKATVSDDEVVVGGTSFAGKSSMYRATYHYAGYIYIDRLDVPVSGLIVGSSARDALARAMQMEQVTRLVTETIIMVRRQSIRNDDLVYRYVPRRTSRPAYRVAN